MPVKVNINFIWSGANAAIPAGWTRNTDFDDKFVKGAADGVDPDVTGGLTTHTHSAAANHSHAMHSHTHAYTLQGGSIGQPNSDAGAGAGIAVNHTHTGVSGAASGGALSSIASTYAAFSNNPPYHKVIYCKSDGTNDIGDDMIGFADADDKPIGWVYCDGNGGTPNLVDKYLIGASTGADAGGTGGTTTNIHTLTHTHSIAAHSHANSTSSNASGTAHVSKSTSPIDGSHKTHTHTVYIANGTALAATPNLTTIETVEPAYKKLMAVQNQLGSEDTPKGIVGLWVGTLANIPSGWILCDGTSGTTDMRGKYLKSSATLGEVGDIGGSNAHTHAAQNHVHVDAGHIHTGTHSAHTIAIDVGDGGLTTDDTTVHPVSVTSGTATYVNGSTSAISSSNEPEYRTVAFIKYAGVGVGGAFLLNML